ncbi:unnamed protein product, partial [Hydatigera taeniaeformis]
MITVIHGSPIFTLVLGVVVLATAFIGCFGASYLNGCLIKLYAILMMILVIGELIWGTLHIALKDQTLKLIEHYFNTSIAEIESGNADPQLLNSIKRIQNSVGIYISWIAVEHTIRRIGEILMKSAVELEKFVSGFLNRLRLYHPEYMCFRALVLYYPFPLLQGCVQVAEKVLVDNRIPLGISIIVLSLIEMGAV